MAAAADRVGIALLGAGSIAAYHLHALAACERAAVRVVVGRDAARAEAVARRHGVPAAGTDVDAALARRDVDAVIVATPDDTHEELATRAATAGKAILLQKPMATTSAACRRILATARNHGVDLQVSFMHRYFEEVRRAREAIAEGTIGAVTSLRLRNATPGPDWEGWFFDATRVRGGVVFQLGVHGIDLALHLAGPILEAAGRTATLVPERALADGRVVHVQNADSAWGTYRFASGAVASHEMSMIEAAGCDRFRLEVYGTRGTIWLRSERGAFAIHAEGASGRRGWFVPDLPAAPFGKAQHDRWLDGLLGVAPPERTATEALAGMLVAEALLRSAEEGGRAEVVEQP